ncbi:MAG: PAC2 family protein [Thermoplasmata archaeon]|nr:PAC2 family protein [Thermoplasmata archaeon]
MLWAQPLKGGRGWAGLEGQRMEYTWKEENLTVPTLQAGAVVLSSFPSAGLATTVAGHYMIRALKLPRVGRFESPDLAPVAIVQGGEVHPTIRVYGRADLGLVLSEFPPTPTQANSIARTILEGAQARKARMLLCLEGIVPNPEDGESAAAGASPEASQVWAAFSHSDPSLRKMFESAGVRTLQDGVIGGVSGALLVQGIGRDLPVVTLLVSARVAEGLPDHRAGAALIETLDRLLPELRIDTQPLRQQAEQIEKALRAALKAHSSSPEENGPGAPAPATDMYR